MNEGGNDAETGEKVTVAGTDKLSWVRVSVKERR